MHQATICPDRVIDCLQQKSNSPLCMQPQCQKGGKGGGGGGGERGVSASAAPDSHAFLPFKILKARRMLKL